MRHQDGLGRPWLLGGVALVGLIAAGAANAQNTPPSPAGATPEYLVTSKTPFSSCTADKVAKQEGTNYPSTEIEPDAAANPANLKNVSIGWQQDRWSDGGSRGLLAGVSFDRGLSWKTVKVSGTTKCEGGPWTRASDPWVTFTANGDGYFMTLAFEPDLPSGGFGPSAMLVNKSSDGGRSWGKPVTLIRDTDPKVLNDKNSITGDPHDGAYAYAVWDRLVDYTLSGGADTTDEPGGEKAGAKPAVVGTMDGVRLARERMRSLRARATATTTEASKPSDAKKPKPAPKPEVEFQGPAYLARTTNGGKNWEKAKVIYDPGDNAQTIGNQIVVLPNGDVLDFFTHIFTNGLASIDYVRSTDKGKTFEKKAHRVAPLLGVQSQTPDEKEAIRDADILFDVVVDPHSGAIHVVWQNSFLGDFPNIAFTTSGNGGRSWSPPVRIDQTPRSPVKLRNEAFIPQVEVVNGTAVVTYYNFQNDTKKGELADSWLVTCKSGCNRRNGWSDETRLTRKSLDYAQAPDAGGLFLGDYMGLASSGKAAVPIFGITDGKNRTSLRSHPVFGFTGKSGS